MFFCFLLLLHFTCLIQKLETILFGIQRPWKSREENLQILTMQRINFSAGHNEDNDDPGHIYQAPITITRRILSNISISIFK